MACNPILQALCWILFIIVTLPIGIAYMFIAFSWISSVLFKKSHKVMIDKGTEVLYESAKSGKHHSFLSAVKDR